MSLDEKIRDGLRTLVEPVDVNEVLSAVDARSARGASRRWPKLAVVAAATVALAGFGAAQLRGDAVQQVSVAPADSEASASTADVPSSEVPAATGSDVASLVELHYGDGTLELVAPPIEGLGEPRMFSIIPSDTGVPTTVRWDLPTQLAGAFRGSVAVTVLPRVVVDQWSGAGSVGVARARSTMSSPDVESRELLIAGQRAVFVPSAGVTPGEGLGLPDRVTLQLMWAQSDGSVVQLFSDIMTETELVAYAETIVRRSR